MSKAAWIFTIFYSLSLYLRSHFIKFVLFDEIEKPFDLEPTVIKYHTNNPPPKIETHSHFVIIVDHQVWKMCNRNCAFYTKPETKVWKKHHKRKSEYIKKLKQAS